MKDYYEGDFYEGTYGGRYDAMEIKEKIDAMVDEMEQISEMIVACAGMLDKLVKGEEKKKPKKDKFKFGEVVEQSSAGDADKIAKMFGN